MVFHKAPATKIQEISFQFQTKHAGEVHLTSLLPCFQMVGARTGRTSSRGWQLRLMRI